MNKTEVSKHDSLSGSLIILLVLTATQKLIGFARAVLVYRWLDPTETGTWALAQAMLDTALPLVLLSIPGCFGRYLERFRQRGSARQFLRQAGSICLTLMGLGGILVFTFRQQLAKLIFGDPHAVSLVLMTAVALVPTAIFAFGNELLVALRLSKSSSRGHFLRSLLFAAFTVILVFAWRKDAIAIIAACGLSYAVAVVPLGRRALRAIYDLPKDHTQLPVRETWRALAPTIVLIWLADFMSNMFLCIDRYMLIHLLPGSREGVLAQIGNYESAQVIPILVATTAFMVARLLLPYLAKDWERGERQLVGELVNRSLKWGAIVLMPGSLLVILCAHVVFDQWFHGKYGDGFALVPWMAGVYLWSGLTALLMNFIWCAERGRWGIAASIVALASNVVLNAWWVPKWGIVGAAGATLTANGVQIFLLLGLAVCWGLRPSLATIAALLLPFTFVLPQGVAWISWFAVTLAAIAEQRDQIRDGVDSFLSRVARRAYGK